MTNPPPDCATNAPDGRFLSPYPHYFTSSNTSSTTAIEQGGPPDPITTGHVYPDTKVVDASRHFVSLEGLKEINDFVPLGTKVAWGEGATPSNGVDNSMALLSPMSQCAPLPISMPLVPGISSFGPILNSWPMPPLPKRRRPSASEPVYEKQEHKKRKASSTGQAIDENTRMTTTTTVTNPPHATPENATTFLTRDFIMPNSPNGQPSMSSATPADAGIISMNAYTQAQPQSQSPPPPHPPPESSSTSESQLATQRARNRVAANKFRRKSKAAVAELETMERALAARHEQLSMMVQGLREEVLGLKNELLMHGNCDCAMIHQYLSNTASRLSMGRGASDTGGHHRPSLGGGGHVPSVTPPGGVPFGNN
ncbi:hypothetical protein SLS53_007226 [Cytospora paraplurivora]|uniref:BZIP domain-containing protein n=1 Tax=Cytospora paraplurivora TaxID=2898453 RepID=A0AAN9U8K9_9PEZI